MSCRNRRDGSGNGTGGGDSRASHTIERMHIMDNGLDDARVIALLHTHLTRARAETATGSAHALDLSGLRAPAVTFYSAWDGEGTAATLVGVGALKALTPEHGEVKSMHTVEAQRLSLETGAWPFFAPARELYARNGFVECPPFGDYRPDPHSVFMTLAPLDAPQAP